MFSSCGRALSPSVFLILSAVAVSTVSAQTYVDREQTVAIDPSRGADPRVDYASLVHFGPWDDRNYQLTLEDLSLLAANEAQIREPLPAFFRVGMRRARPALSRGSAARYPLHAANVFRIQATGFQIDGQFYRAASRENGRYYVDLSVPVVSPGEGESGGESLVDSNSSDVRVTNPQKAAESAIAIHPTDTNKVIAASMGPGDEVRMHYSTDGGSSWSQTDLPFGATCCDPSVGWSSDGQMAYATVLGQCVSFTCELFFYRSDDGGVTWNDLEDDSPGNPRRSVSQQGDREFLHVDIHPTSPHKDNVYITYHEANVLQLARSTDHGNSWTGHSFSMANDELGIAGDITTDRSGNVFFAWPAYNSRTIRVSKSTDGGSTFGASSVVSATEGAYSYPIPTQPIREARIYVSAAADLSSGAFADSIYLAWNDSTAPVVSNPVSNHSRVQVAYSRDGGNSWSVTTPHSTSDMLSVDRWHPFLVVGPNGTVHVIYYDTRNEPNRLGVDIYYSYSTDGAQTWSAPARVTSETSPKIDDYFEFGDYIGLDMVMNELVGVYTDNRDELGWGNESVDVYATNIADGGAPPNAGRIYGSRDVSGTPLTIDKNSNGSDLDLAWAAACGQGTDYAIYEGELGLPNSKLPIQCSTSGATSATITPGSGNRFYLVVAIDASQEGSYGRDGSGVERAPDPGSCFAQSIGNCP